jgi:DNA-binding GntR family transcriptional regulator
VTALGNISTASLREKAARAIRTGIITGEITQGELYSVPTLSAQLGVSATPVREAMLDLVSEGLIEPVRNRGYRVVSLSRRDLEGILQLRLLLEVPSAGEVAVSHDAAALPRFKVLAKQLPTLARKADFQAYLDADQEFHLGLLGLLDNPRLTEMVARLRNQTRLFDIGKLVVTGELAESGAEHEEILAAIEKRDRRAAEKVVSQHLLRLRKAWPDE